jgi:hypothetical protein
VWDRSEGVVLFVTPSLAEALTKAEYRNRQCEHTALGRARAQGGDPNPQVRLTPHQAKIALAIVHAAGFVHALVDDSRGRRALAIPCKALGRTDWAYSLEEVGQVLHRLVRDVQQAGQ